MNWGLRIAILYLGFVALIVTLVVKASTTKEELEYADYYQREVNFQQQINSSAALLKSGLQPAITANSEGVVISIPDSLQKAPFSGEATFFRSNDASKDVTVVLAPNVDGVSIPNEKFVSGLYNVRINWTSKYESYYYETLITIP